MLSANDGKMIKASAKSSLMSTILVAVSGSPAPGSDSMSAMPTAPNINDEKMKTFVAIFCMISVYHRRTIK
jgi:hypothetical protein